ncbi:KAP family NTPase [Aeromonas allosaccharophila]|uniref:KAP family P-loop NTPase fold protein n=1 Tax=Aeromonas allosaccharophila TaxID=656 RepID=UPI001F16C5F5|nr:P-loop NTPase fold protein [Aeromonas allosaccharophila]MCE9847717.1 KAP family NTPase [Aeromonas allosaccharophila]
MAVAPFKWDETIQWDGPGAIAGGEELAGDRLERARYAEFLTNYLAAEGKQRNYVLNLNAEWGAGKTWFIKRWYMELKAHYPTVYIDAWQQDFSDDPLLTVISSIIDQLKEVAGKENKIPEGMRQRLLGLFKVGGKLALKAAVKKAGLEENDFSLEGEDANLLVDALCSNQKERYESIQHLKQEIRQWVEGAVALGKGKLDYPAFILIDELDRCRPSYAVEMLETIKHIFDIKGVVFVLATDTEQLQHAIKVIYGEGFDGKKYLERFYDSQRTLKQGSRYEMAKSRLDLYGDDFWLSEKFFLYPKMSKMQLAETIADISKVFELSLRDMHRLISHLVAILTNIRKSIDIVFLVTLYCIHLRKRDAYNTLLMERYNLKKALSEGGDPNFEWIKWAQKLDIHALQSVNISFDLSGLDKRCQSAISKVDALNYFIWLYALSLDYNTDVDFLDKQIDSGVMFDRVSYSMQQAAIQLVNKHSGFNIMDYDDFLMLGFND